MNEPESPPGDPPDRSDNPSPRLRSRIYRGLIYFLEAIGLKEERGADPAAQLSRLRLYHTEFRKLLAANNSFLETLGDLENMSLGRRLFDRAYIERRVVRGISDIHAMVESLNVISGNGYPVLRERQEALTAELTAVVEEHAGEAETGLVIDMQNISSIHADLAGGKMANLGELRRKLGIPAPDGMVVTTQAYRLLIEESGMRSWIQDRHMEFESTQDVEKLAGTLKEKILGLRMPPELQFELHAAYDRLCERTGEVRPVAVRSSAVGEDSLFSYAGQFLSLLNISKENLCDAYLKVLASLYAPEAIHYRKLHGISGESGEMAVGFLSMVEAEASGVIFTKDPNAPDSGDILIQAVRGLGIPLVDGRVSPEVIYVPRACEPEGIRRFASRQGFRSTSAEGDGLMEEVLDESEAVVPCISDGEALQLARWALQLESHFGWPQDIEWAVDKDRGLFVLQSRPLRLSQAHGSRGDPLPGVPLVLTGGETACPGVGAGPAVHMDADAEPGEFPAGSVLIARRSSPKFVRLMSKAAAIVTDVGSTTGHMASLAREFRVPALLNIGSATRSIAPGTIVTVDANNGFVYEGDVSARLRSETGGEQPEEEELPVAFSGPESQFLEKVLRLLAPLNLTEPGSADFAPAKCRTLHDLARFVHEKSYHEMFSLGDNVGDLRGASFYLDIFLPIDLYIVDLGGGLNAAPKNRKVKRAQISSVPFAALLKGMLHEKIPRFGPRAMDMRGLFSIMMRHATTSPEEEQSFREPCYAIISDNYVNYTARVGYHFSIVDAYCSSIANKNYISLLFRGGAADYLRRNRRVRAIGDILKEYGFSVEVAHDRASARLSKASKEETLSRIEMIGSLFQFFRQMDAAMVDEHSVAIIRDAFLNGDYGLETVFRAGAKGTARKEK
ncbi:MAG: hypothetical protein LLG06_17060 [Desulfobacteraceae bacterium]|nr:hypothetical protein [Desulfobacteraceae bacterium]